VKKYYMETIVGLFVLVGLTCVGYLSVKLGNVPLFRENTYEVYARFASVPGLRVGSSVQVFGIEVGTVALLAIDNERQVAVVGMSIRKGVRLYSDATGTLATMGLIGDSYIRVDPGGTGEPMKSGDYIVNTVTPPTLDQLIGQYIFGRAKEPGGSGGAAKKGPAGKE
jgi:phospholipid/cholesterol/gamma-HCH transport system substrate-binding protein